MVYRYMDHPRDRAVRQRIKEIAATECYILERIQVLLRPDDAAYCGLN
jgi:hypothetical protein